MLFSWLFFLHVFFFQEAAKVEEEERAFREPLGEPAQEVPEGFEMVEMNGRKVLRMK